MHTIFFVIIFITRLKPSFGNTNNCYVYFTRKTNAFSYCIAKNDLIYIYKEDLVRKYFFFYQI